MALSRLQGELNPHCRQHTTRVDTEGRCDLDTQNPDEVPYHDGGYRRTQEDEERRITHHAGGQMEDRDIFESNEHRLL